jgi:hypothetical protein
MKYATPGGVKRTGAAPNSNNVYTLPFVVT